jgi:hypothetical protein
MFSAEVHYAIKSTIRSRQLVFHLFAYFGGVYTKYGKYYDRNGRYSHTTLDHCHGLCNTTACGNGCITYIHIHIQRHLDANACPSADSYGRSPFSRKCGCPQADCPVYLWHHQ